VPAAELARIFEKFYRVEQPHRATGTGWALNLQGIVEAHGASSAPRTAPKEGRVHDHAAARREGERLMTKGGGARILVADDEKPIRRFLKTSLSAWDYFVVESATGAETLEKAVSSRPDVIILDLGLPDMDGVDVVREIRSRSKIRSSFSPCGMRSRKKWPPSTLGGRLPDEAVQRHGAPRPYQGVLRRYLPADAEEVFRAGSIEIDVPGHRVTVGGRDADVTPTEFDVLKLLVASAGRVVTHRQFLQRSEQAEDLEACSISSG